MTIHFLLAGCLFVWMIAGPHLAPRRSSVRPARRARGRRGRARHPVPAALRRFIAPIDVSAAQRQGAATMMYYGGDVTELLSGRWATP
jgi:putative membrane protein